MEFHMGNLLLVPKEYIKIMRRIFDREGPVEFDGKRVVYKGEGATGLGKPLKSILCLYTKYSNLHRVHHTSRFEMRW